MTTKHEYAVKIIPTNHVRYSDGLRPAFLVSVQRKENGKWKNWVPLATAYGPIVYVSRQSALAAAEEWIAKREST